MSNDPRVLMEIFAELDRTVLQWTTDFCAISETVRSASMETTECVERIHSRILAVREVVEDALAVARNAEVAQQRARDMASVAYADAGAAAQQSQQTIGAADTVKSAWQAGLQRANGMLMAADAELRRAEAELMAARSRLAEAERQYNAAVNALNSCKASYTVDRNGRRIYRNCSGEAATASSAADRVKDAGYVVQAAQTDVQHAQAEVGRCRDLVARCQTGHSQATSLVGSAKADLAVAQGAIAAGRAGQAEAQEAADLAAQAVGDARELMSRIEKAAQLVANMRNRMAEMPDSTAAIDELSSRQRDIDVSARSMLRDLEDRLRRYDAAGDIHP